jgi:hypothetical protein
MYKIYDCAGDIARQARNKSYGSGDETPVQSKRLAMSGDDHLVPQAERLLDRINADVQVPNQEWEPSEAGAFPVVPDAIAGSPLSMRRREPVYTDRAPVKIMVCQTSSWGVTTDAFMRRGVAILALVMALQQHHPVELIGFDINIGYDDDRETVIGWRVNTMPLDLAGACYTLTSMGFTRNLVYDVAAQYSRETVAFPATYRLSGGHEVNAPYFLSLKFKLGGNAHSLLLPPCELRDLAITDPVRWINENVERFNSP